MHTLVYTIPLLGLPTHHYKGVEPLEGCEHRLSFAGVRVPSAWNLEVMQKSWLSGHSFKFCVGKGENDGICFFWYPLAPGAALSSRMAGWSGSKPKQASKYSRGATVSPLGRIKGVEAKAFEQPLQKPCS